MKKNSTFEEQYVVKVNRLAGDYWVFGELVDVKVVVQHGVNEKSSHARAEVMVKNMYPDCEIVSVTYC